MPNILYGVAWGLVQDFACKHGKSCAYMRTSGGTLSYAISKRKFGSFNLALKHDKICSILYKNTEKRDFVCEIILRHL